MSTENHGTEGIVAADPDRILTYGEKAVGLTFNAELRGRPLADGPA